jgi:hypothetical protein
VRPSPRDRRRVAVTPLPQLSVYLDLQWDRRSDFGDWNFSSVNEGEPQSGVHARIPEILRPRAELRDQGVVLALQDTMDVKPASNRFGR